MPGARHRPRRTLLAGWPAGRARTWWSGLVGGIGAVVGLAPHALHHVGLLAGTALVAGAGGTALVWAPALGLAVFAAMFSL